MSQRVVGWSACRPTTRPSSQSASDFESRAASVSASTCLPARPALGSRGTIATVRLVRFTLNDRPRGTRDPTLTGRAPRRRPTGDRVVFRHGPVVRVAEDRQSWATSRSGVCRTMRPRASRAARSRPKDPSRGRPCPRSLVEPPVRHRDPNGRIVGHRARRQQRGQRPSTCRRPHTSLHGYGLIARRAGRQPVTQSAGCCRGPVWRVTTLITAGFEDHR